MHQATEPRKRSVLDAAAPKASQEGDTEERPGVTVYCDERVQDGRCTRTPATAHAESHLGAL
ncbi:Chromosome segregation ATPase [Giardia duodenalis]|uniref:Chromosome segregation ATPase n=1 Tax=Giardia intestinalis TaxID=5741 RepID=V6TQ72_GIAIN|nr:Chromosome segregation ATPase [Giardia intestinalis]